MIIISTRKQKAKAYEEKYADIPRDYLDRLGWMYDKFHLDLKKATKILQTKQRMLDTIRFEKEFFIVLYEEPEGAPRPRARYINKSNLIPSAKSYPGYIQIYSLTGAEDRNYMKRLLNDDELNQFNTYLIYTPCFVEYAAYFKTPSYYNVEETYLAELGLMRPIYKPDYDNIGKKYSDMYNGNVWLDDSLVIKGTVDKYYSLLPRVEISLKYLNMLYNKHQYRSIKARLPDQEIKYFK